MKANICLILHNIRSVHNVGAIFRTADAIGVQKIYCTGYTPIPQDRFGRPRKDFVKTALGAEKTVSWKRPGSLACLLKKLKKESVEIIAIEQSKKSQDYKTHKPKGSIALIVGNEREGLPNDILGCADTMLEIPMRGAMVRQAHHPKNYHPEHGRGKESLNVSVALGIVLYRLFDR